MNNDKGNILALSPLADPVFNEVFANVEVAGLAMESFIRAVLEADNEILVGKIKSVTPQRVHSSVMQRGSRVDIEIETEADELIIAEIQIDPDIRIMVRNLFTSSHVFRESSVKGDTPTQMAKRMPKVIHINLLGYKVRKSSKELLEPFKILYTKKPHDVAIPNFSGYNIQLPIIAKMELDFTNALHCWCYAIYTAHVENKTLQEVVEMSKPLQDYAVRDPGFVQFCERYKIVASDPTAQRQYIAWIKDIMREQGIKEAAWLEGLEEGKKEGIETVALNMLRKNHPVELVAELTSLPIEEVKALTVSSVQ